MEAAFKRFFEAARTGQSDGRACVKPLRFKARGQEPGLRFFDPKQFELDAVNARQALLRQPVDGALRKFSLTPEGALVEPLRALGNQQARLARYQRSVVRKVRGSFNRMKAAARLGSPRRRVARQRTEWLYQLSMRLAGEHEVVALEGLHIQAMLARARGTADAPGPHVACPSGSPGKARQDFIDILR